MIYGILAPFYDAINSDIDYSEWCDFFEKIIGREYRDKKPELVLDLGCGTGKMTLELAKRGYDMTGVDYSVEMLDIARAAAEAEGLSDKTLWLCQNMCSFELYGTVDLAISCLDSVNHLISREELIKCFALTHNYLIPDGIFIFDINGKGKFENIYADNSYVMEECGAVCTWENYYNPKSRLCDFYINVFKENSDGLYERYTSMQREKMYTLRQIKSMLNECGFEFVGAYSDFEFSEAVDEDERIYIVAKCKKI